MSATIFKNNRNCVDCVYKGLVEGVPHCAYIFKVGYSRPCPPGDLCTVKVSKKPAWKKKKGKNNG